MRLYSVANIIIHKFNQQIQVKPSTLVLILLALSAMRKKSIGPDGIPGEILKFGVKNITPYLARLLDIRSIIMLSQVTGKKL